MIILDSKISSVTVFKDRALVVRNAVQTLEKGIYFLVFDNLPSNINRNTIQVNGRGDAIILDVATKEINFTEVAQEEIQLLNNQQIELKDKLDALADAEKETNKEKDLLEKITTKLTSEQGQAGELTLDLLAPEKWVPFLDFYKTKQTGFNSEARTIEKEKKRIKEEINRIESEQSKLHHEQYKTAYRVVVKIEIEEENEIDLELIYVLSGARWKPVYDIRVDSTAKKVQIAYKATVSQNTTEAWNDVKVYLSTAQPHLKTAENLLVPMYLDLKSVQTGMDKYSDDELKQLYKSSMKEGSISRKGESEDMEEIGDERRKRRVIKKTVALAESNKTSVEFVVDGLYSITNNDDPHEVTIMISEFESKLYYSTTPKLEQLAFLKAELINNTEFPLLSGSANIFLDNAFVATSDIEMVTPNEKLLISLGVDPSLKVEHKFLNKFYKNEGFVSKKNKQYVQYEIIITNNKKTEELVIVQDQLPISKHEDIKIELIEPNLKEGKHNFKKKDHEVLKWTLTIKGAETIKIPLQYSIEYPNNDEIVYK